MPGSIIFENMLSIRVLEWLIILVGCKFNPLRPVWHVCPANVIAYIFTIKLLQLLLLGTIDLKDLREDENL